MSDGPEAAPRPQPKPPGGSRQSRRVLLPTIITLVALLFIGAILTGVWTDRLWFKSVDFASVYSTMLVTRVVLFVVFGLIFAGLVVANVVIAYRTKPPSLGPVRSDDPVLRYREAIDPLRKLAVIAIGLVMFVFAGSAAAGQWETYQKWANGTSFGQKDVFFGKDIGFFVFDWPWMRFLASFGFAVLLVSALAVVLVHYLYGGIRLSSRTQKISRAATVHLSILAGLFLLLKSFAYWLDRFAFAMNTNSLFTGINYTDDHARIPSKNILMVVAIICALLFFANAIWSRWMLPVIGLGLMVLTALLIGGIWPTIMQSFQVKPSEPDKESPFIQKNISSTRSAFDLADVQVESYTAKKSLTPNELKSSAESRVSTRLLDPTLVSPAFEQLQQVRGYYTVPDTLDVDRYQLQDSEQRQDIVIAARELDLNGLQESQRNWANDHTVYTHGYGVIAARGNERGPQGEPVWVEKNIPPEGELDLKKEPRIYYGENSPAYSIVGRPDGDAPIEVDIPRGGADAGDDKENATQNTYDGSGGVPVGNLFTKLLYAAKFSEPNIVLSSRVNANSKIMYDRHPRDRVKKVAPWLTVDGDPYPAVVDGRVVWIVDGYTTSGSYPYSQKVSLQEATSDTLTGTGAQARLPTDQVNYVRNSVKAVVDAYDGTVDLYQWDESDPILKTWMKVFPGTVKPKSEISADLQAHLRYPVDLFKVQRDILSTYHVTDPQTFYEGSERWKVPDDPAASGSVTQPPYYLSVEVPGEDSPKFSLTSVYQPYSRQNLASFVSVNSEASDEKGYGKIQILQLTSQTQVDGPSQIANAFQSDRRVSAALLQYKQAGTNILYGNLLTLPVGQGLLYVQPVYIRRSEQEGAYPVLQFVIASFGDKVGFGQTLDEALRVALGIEEAPADVENPESGGDAGGSAGGNGGGSGGSQGDQSATDLIGQAQSEYDKAQAALKAGDLAEYQTRINKMAALLNQAQSALEPNQSPATQKPSGNESSGT